MIKHLLFLLLLYVLSCSEILAQNYNISNSTISTCSGNFFDTGGNGGDYGNNENVVMTFCSSVSGECIRVNFTAFNLESGFDYLTVYNGATTGAPVLGTYTGTTIPAMITSTTGCLTFEFSSDFTVTRPGWAATLSCVPCPGSACPSCNGGTPPANDACASATNLGAIPSPAACPNGVGAWANFNTTNICATAENPYSALTGCQPSGNMASPAADVWYRFTITGPTLNIQIAGMQTPNIGLYAGTNCNNLIGRGCAIGGGGALNTSFGGLAPGTYYLQVSGGNPNDQCAFTLGLQNNYDCAGCVIQSGFTATPPPVNGTYQAGQTVTFCYTITDYNQTSVNWLHGIVPTFMGGWDMSTLTTTPANDCSGQGTWSWYNTNVTSTATGLVTGPGFYYESSLGSPSGNTDGNPGNNYGDNNPGNSCDWTFCWTITTLDPAVCVPGTSLNMTVDTYGDGESGSWTSLACVGDPVADFFATLECCVPPLISVTDPLCFGQNTGSATGTGQGTAPWDYVWTNSAGTTIQTANGINGSNTINNLAAGNYTLTCTDNTGCISTANFTITAPAQLVVNTVVVSASCNGNSDGSATANAAGGTAPNTYLWSPSGGTGTIETGLTAGTYTVTVTDMNGCTASAQAVINEPPPLVINVVSVNAACGANNGSLTINVAGAIGAIQYSIDGGTTFQAGNLFNNLASGNYNIVVQDASGCQGTTTGQVNSSLAPVINSAPFTDVTCNAGNDGTITINAAGGSGALSYSVDNGLTFQPSNSFTGLAAGNYNIVVEDANGCQVTIAIAISEPPVIVVNLAGTDPTCGLNNGTITTNAAGGTGTYQFSIDGGANQASAVFNNLAPGNHTVTVTDLNGCSASTALLLNTAPILQANGLATSAACGAPTGGITANATGGTPGYQYSINGGPLQLSGTFNSLLPGNYDIEVTDANGCSSSVIINVPDQPGPVITSTVVVNASCFAGNDGSITVNINGGTPVLDYSLNNGPYQPSNIFNNLPAGTYSVSIKDGNGCTASVSGIIVSEPTVISGPWVEQPSTCSSANGSVTVNGAGGTGLLNYSIDGGPFSASNTFNNLSSGNYNITIQDANGCSLIVPVVVTDNPGPVITSINTTPANCNGGNDGALTIVISSGIPAFQYSIDNGTTNQPVATFTGLTANAYTILVTDANGCTVTDIANITEPPLITSSEIVTGSTCGNSNGTVTINGSNGTGLLQYSLNGGAYQASGTFNNLAAGNYNYSVQDANGCIINSAFVVIDAPGPVISNNVVTDVTCFNGSDGSLELITIGGTLPVSYTLNGGVAQPTGLFSGLTIGAYTVLATDANGCTVSVMLNVNEQPEIIVATQITSSTCGNANGEITVNAVGGTGTYTYSINGGVFQASNIFGALLAGNYDIITQDANGCQNTINVSVSDMPPPVISTVSTTNASCTGASDGTITITAIGGTGALTYSIDNGASSQPASLFNNLPAGNYDIIVTDMNGCTAVSTTIITQPLPLSITTLIVASTCTAANGSVTINAAGGTAPYSYSLNGGANQPGNLFSNLNSGNYDVTVTDVNGCILQLNFAIPDLPGPVITSTNVTDVLCNGGSDGSAQVNINGGTAPLTFALNGGISQPSGVFANIIAGNHSVVVTDANGCNTTANFIISEPTPVTAILTPASSSCGNNNGSLTVVASGGIAPYLYSLNGGANSGSGVFGNLLAGNYNIVVTDNNGCSYAFADVITDMPAPAINNVVTSDVLCFAGNDGAITINASGGTGLLSYSIDNGITSQAGILFQNLTSGIYDIIVTDANGCTITTQVNINEPTQLSGVSNFTPASCGNSDGTLTVVANGGTPGYQYSINGGTSYQASGTFNNLLAGNYDIQILDANGCITIINVAVNNTLATVINLVSNTDLSCFNSSNGSITINAAGGTAPLSYSIDNGATFQSANVFLNLPGGTYDIIVEDAIGCQVSNNISVIEPPLLTVATVNNNTICSQSNGTITINANGGTGIYNYSIDGGITTQLSNIFNGISSGNYTVQVTDVNGCTANTNTIITDAPAPVIQSLTETDINCNGGSDGQIIINATGSGALQYSIDNGATSQPSNNFSGLTAGNYSILVTDANGCTTSIQSILNEPSVISFSTSSTNASCGNSDGSLTINANGGTGLLTYSIDNGITYQSNPVFTNIQAANYQVVVLDANGCSLSGAGIVNNSAAPVISATAVVDINCFGANNGSITITANGGTAPLQYSINNGITYQAGNIFPLLPPGNFDIVVVDINGCQATATVTITEPLLLDAILNITNTTCGSNNGTLTIAASGGTGVIQFSNDNGITFQSSATFNNLSAGNYTAVIEDINGCQSNFPYIINDAPGPVILNAVSTDITCNGAGDGIINITANGGSGNLSYSIDNGITYQPSNIFTSLQAGNYTVTVIDTNACTTVSNVIITEPLIIGFSTTDTPASCGNSDGSLNVNATGGTGTYSYSIDNGITFQSSNIFSNINSGNYNVVVTDANNCSTTAVATVSNAAAPVITATAFTDITCNGDNDGTISITANGGTGVLQYSIDNGISYQPANNFTNLAAGNYDVLVEDINGCQATTTISIIEPPLITSTINVINTTCSSGNGSIDADGNGGTGALSYSIDNGNTFQASDIFNNLFSGNYTLLIQDANGCQKTFTFVITDTPGPAIQSVATTNISCFGLNDGVMTINAPGGTAPLQYSNDNGVTYQVSNVFNNLSASNYTVVVLDANGCSVQALAVITEPSEITGNFTATTATCGNADGSVTMNVAGGTGSLQYSIDNGISFQSSPAFTFLGAGNYPVIIRDANGCEITIITIVNNAAAPSIQNVAVTGITCNGNDNGIISISASGGTGLLSYSIDNGNTTQPASSFTNLPPGIYNIIVTDINGCSAIDQVILTEPVVLNALAVSTPSTCGNNNGTITINANGGTGILMYSVNGGASQASNVFNNLLQGLYSINITDANGCTYVLSNTVGNAPGPLLNLVIETDITCFGFNDGSITVLANGGTPPLQYSIDNGLTFIPGFVFGSLAPGNYDIMVNDANGCTVNSTATLAQPVTVNFTQVVIDANCGNSDGSITVNASGGTGNYSYSINNGLNFQPLNTFNNLVAGTYTVVVRDGSDCTTAAPVTINNSSAPVILSNPVTNVTCFGLSDGTINITVAGGAIPLSYSIDGGFTWQATGTFANLDTGTYNIIVSDILGCNASSQAIITQPSEINLNSATTSATCGNSDGTATVSVTGGTGAYAYSLNGGTSQPTGLFTNLGAANYSITVTNSAGCSENIVVSISNTNAPVITSVSAIDLPCFGSSNGSITISATGGTGALQYSIDNGATFQANNNFNNLNGGIYSILVEDQNGCISTSNIDIIEPDLLTLNSLQIPSTCGNSNGEIHLITSGGTGSIQFSINNGLNYQTSPVFDNLIQGPYSILVTDANGCTANNQIAVTNTPGPLVTTLPVTNSTCFGADNGTLLVNVSGGTGPFQYSIDNGTTLQGSNYFGALSPGAYTIIVYDANNCSTDSVFSVTEPTEVQLGLSINNSTCNAANASITLTGTGGSGIYTYSINGGVSFQGSGIFTNIIAGNYQVMIQDANGCTSSGTANIIDAPPPVIQSVSVTDITCNGLDNGILNVNANGGTTPLQYSIDNGATYQQGNGFTNLAPGIYNIMVLDSNGCNAISTGTITEPPALLTSVASTSALCNGSSDGSATVTVLGGSTPYTYLWSSAAGTSQTVNNLPAGVYIVTVMDANGCTSQDSIPVTEPAALAVQFSTTDISCNGLTDGSISAGISGGTAPYTYAWSSSTISGTGNNGLAAGTYTLTVSDVNNCSTIQVITISEPALLTLNTSSTQVSCFGSANGSASVIVNGGTAPYNYLWSDNTTLATATSLTSGTYSVTVTDNQGCTQVSTVNVGTPSELTAISTTTPVICNNDGNGTASVIASGGTTPYSYNWNNGTTTASASNLNGGNYTVTITDINNCSVVSNVTVSEPAPIIVTTSGATTLCIGQSTIISATAQGGNGGFIYNWSNGFAGISQTVNPGNTTSYSVVVTDTLGCTSTGNPITVIVNPPLSLTISDPDTICEGETVTISALASGGDGGPYTFAWSGLTSTGSSINVTPASTTTYTVTVSDGCGTPVQFNTVIISVNPLPVVEFVPIPAEGCAPLNVFFDNNSTSPTPGSLYQWNFGDNSTGNEYEPSHLYTEPGNYTVSLQVTSSEGCVSQLIITDAVKVYPVPDAAFSSTPSVTNILSPLIDFSDTGYGATVWTWDFGDNSSYSNDQNPQHLYETTGIYNITLYVMNDFGCADTAYGEIIIEGASTIYIPNAFTPNGDGLNDIFTVHGIGLSGVSMSIFNRWGNTVFTSNSQLNGWDGTDMNSGTMCPVDVYIYKVNAKNIKGEPQDYTGRVTLVR